ncbi:DUF6584 family protein [Microbacterium saperdae]
MSSDPVPELVAVWARSLTDMPFVTYAVDAAAEALTKGYDGQALRELAGLSRSSPEIDTRILLERALAEAGVSRDVHREFAHVLLLREIAVDALRGQGSVRDVSEFAHSIVGHDGPEVALDLVALDDDIDLHGEEYGSKPEVAERVQSFVAATEYLTHPDAWAVRNPRPDGSPQDIDALIDRANSLGAEGRLREAAGILRTRLADDPTDESLRRALAALYRLSGHPDQAGRYEITTSTSVRSERDAYARFLVSINADEARIRQLSILPPGAAIPEHLLAKLADLRKGERARTVGDGMAEIGFPAFLIIAFLGSAVVYFMTLFDAEPAGITARIAALLALASLCLSVLGLAVTAALQHRVGAALGWAAATTASVVLCALLLSAVFAEIS